VLCEYLNEALAGGPMPPPGGDPGEARVLPPLGSTPLACSLIWSTPFERRAPHAPPSLFGPREDRNAHFRVAPESPITGVGNQEGGPGGHARRLGGAKL
jgi:hypothetical protein